DLVGGHGVDHVRVRNAPVSRERAGREWVYDLHHVLGLAGHIHRRHDRVAVQRIGDLRAGGSLVYDSGVRTACLRELVLEQLLRLLGFGPGHVELLARVPAEGQCAESGDADQKQPGEQHLPAVLEGPAPESIERGCHRDAPSLKAVVTYALNLAQSMPHRIGAIAGSDHRAYDHWVLYGRDAERDQIGALLKGARESRSGALVVRGEPGIGKTALLADTR